MGAGMTEQWPVLFVAPRAGSGGVGDFAESALSAISLQDLGEPISQIRSKGPGGDSVRDVFSFLRELRNFERVHGQSYVLHCEFSAGSIAPFWLGTLSRSRHKVGVVHDPQRAVWWPLRTKLVARSKWLNHAIHLPLRGFWGRFERLCLRNFFFITLTKAGQVLVSNHFKTENVFQTPHFVFAANAGPRRKKLGNIGFYGHFYKSKGFEFAPYFRKSIPETVKIIVAGRGTEALSQFPGISYLGSLNDEQQEAFFQNLDLLVLPYNRNSVYGEFAPASGALARAISFGVPVAGLESPGIAEFQSSGAVAISASVEGLSEIITDLSLNPSKYARLSLSAANLREQLPIENYAAFVLKNWAKSEER
jgi:glycosyltransferase involved in cell wall biosynthesis